MRRGCWAAWLVMLALVATQRGAVAFLQGRRGLATQATCAGTAGEACPGKAEIETCLNDGLQVVALADGVATVSLPNCFSSPGEQTSVVAMAPGCLKCQPQQVQRFLGAGAPIGEMQIPVGGNCGAEVCVYAVDEKYTLTEKAGRPVAKKCVRNNNESRCQLCSYERLKVMLPQSVCVRQGCNEPSIVEVLRLLNERRRTDDSSLIHPIRCDDSLLPQLQALMKANCMCKEPPESPPSCFGSSDPRLSATAAFCSKLSHSPCGIRSTSSYIKTSSMMTFDPASFVADLVDDASMNASPWYLRDRVAVHADYLHCTRTETEDRVLFVDAA